MADFTVRTNEDQHRVNELVERLNQMARDNQAFMNQSGSWTGDAQYDSGYESGLFRSGDELETMLRELGFWDER